MIAHTPGHQSLTPWWSGRNIDLYVGDAREVLTGFADESVDCIVTSPPYFGLRSYDTGRWEPNPGTCPHIPAPSIGQHCPHCDANWSDGQYGQEDTVEQYVHHLVAVFDQARRVLHRHGTLWLNLGDSYAGNKPRTAPKHGPNSVMRGAHNTGKWMTGTVEGIAPKNLIGIPWRVAFALQARGWLRNAIVWAKTNGQPSSVNDRLTTTYELVFLFTRSPRYHFNLDAIRIPVKHPNDKRRQKNPTGAKGKNPADVWAFPTRASREAHLAAYPVDIPTRCIAAGCRPGGIVLDPFNTGTTGVAALQQGRRYTGIDLSATYAAITRRRLQALAHAEMAATTSTSQHPADLIQNNSAPSGTDSVTVRSDRLDVFAPPRMDRRAHPAPAANTNISGSAIDPPDHQARDTGRTPDPCPPYPQPPTVNKSADTAAHSRITHTDHPGTQANSSATAGHR